MAAADGQGGDNAGGAGEVVYTVGHSTRSSEALVALLESHGVEVLADVRRWSTSEHNPQFDREALAEALGEAGIDYRHLEVLGGYRDPADDSPNGGWESDGFQGYADHLLSGEARGAVESLARMAGERTLAVMCAERVPWRCHRQILADWFAASGLEVVHLLDEERREAHEIRVMARITEDGRVVYPPPQADQGELFGDDGDR